MLNWPPALCFPDVAACISDVSHHTPPTPRKDTQQLINCLLPKSNCAFFHTESKVVSVTAGSFVFICSRDSQKKLTVEELHVCFLCVSPLSELITHKTLQIFLPSVFVLSPLRTLNKLRQQSKRTKIC